MKKEEISFTEKQTELASKLTPLQRKFIIELIKPNTSQRQAYIKAGGTAKGEASQDSAAHRMFSNVQVRNFYDSMMETKTISSIMSRDEALERLSKSARVKITDICSFKYIELEGKDGETYFDTVWTMKNAEDIDPDIASCIKSVSFTKNGPKIELYDANGSIKLLADMEGWNAPKKTELSGPNEKPIEVNVDSPEVAAAISNLMDKL